jgi:hypothetical protein
MVVVPYTVGSRVQGSGFWVLELWLLTLNAEP